MSKTIKLTLTDEDMAMVNDIRAHLNASDKPEAVRQVLRKFHLQMRIDAEAIAP